MLKKPGRRYGLGKHCVVEFLGHMKRGVYMCTQLIFVKCVQLRGKEVVVECKFDGDRIQVHKNGNNIHFWSRHVPHGSPPFKI